jgi:hypothetical protein
MERERFVRDLVREKHGARLGMVGFAKPSAEGYEEFQERLAQTGQALDEYLRQHGNAESTLAAFREDYLR